MAIVVYSFQGAELVGNVASEAPHPEQALPKIIRTIGIRIILFYILAVSVLAILNPSGWVKSSDSGPFVEVFREIRFRRLHEAGDSFGLSFRRQFRHFRLLAHVLVYGSVGDDPGIL